MHVPTEDKDGTEKDCFYDKLEGTYNNFSTNDIRLMILDTKLDISWIFISGSMTSF